MPMPPHPPVIEDPRILARYPFLPQAVKHTRSILSQPVSQSGGNVKTYKVGSLTKFMIL